MQELPDLYFDLLIVIGGICATGTILCFIFGVSGLGLWLVSSPFVTPAQHQSILEFANKSLVTTLPFFGGAIAIALTVNFLVEAQSKRSERQARLKLTQQLNQRAPNYAVSVTNSLISELADTQRRVRDLELRLNDRIDEQIRLLNRIAELEEALYGSAHAADFYPPVPPSALSETRRCRYLNEGLLRCAVHPDRIDCQGCRDYSG